jgi:Zn-dependent M28 family amino/carboxypeptidase
VTPAAIGRHLDAVAAAAEAGGGTREAGGAGDRATRRMLVRTLRAAGWRVTEQPVRFPFFVERRPPEVVPAGGGALSSGDVRTLQFSPGGEVRGPVRVIGFVPGRDSAAGCRAPDFRILRRGEIALIQRGTCPLRRKARNAERAGAAAVLIPNDGRPGRITTYAGSLGDVGVGIPVLALSTDAGRVVAAAPRARVSVDAVAERRRTGNVLAELGSGRRVLMAGAHLDSVAAGPGLNDNGSGMAALLSVAEAFRGRPPAGVRLRLGFWGAEELGLIGARRYVRGLGRRERRAIRAYLNFDMVGTPRGRPGVYASAPALARLLRGELRATGRDRIDREDLDGASDHAAFQAAGVPIGGVFTGLDRCYHRACDDADNVDRALAADVARAAGGALLELATRE